MQPKNVMILLKSLEGNVSFKPLNSNHNARIRYKIEKNVTGLHVGVYIIQIEYRNKIKNRLRLQKGISPRK